MGPNFNGNRGRGSRRGNRQGPPRPRIRAPQPTPVEPATSSGITLADAPLGTPLKVKGISGGQRAQARLAALGILPGELVEIKQRDNGGPVLLDVKGTRVALGRGISCKVLVSG